MFLPSSNLFLRNLPPNNKTQQRQELEKRNSRLTFTTFWHRHHHACYLPHFSPDPPCHCHLRQAMPVRSSEMPRGATRCEHPLFLSSLSSSSSSRVQLLKLTRILTSTQQCKCLNNAAIACAKKCGGKPTTTKCPTATKTTATPSPTPTLCGSRSMPPCPDGRQTCIADPSNLKCSLIADCAGLCVILDGQKCGGIAGLGCPTG